MYFKFFIQLLIDHIHSSSSCLYFTEVGRDCEFACLVCSAKVSRQSELA
jgi:hypothetical protein